MYLKNSNINSRHLIHQADFGLMQKKKKCNRDLHIPVMIVSCNQPFYVQTSNHRQVHEAHTTRYSLKSP